MIGSQCKTLSSAFVITAVIAVFCLAATPRALAESNGQSKENALNCPIANAGSAAGSVVEGHELQLLILIMAIAAYLRVRIEWSKEKVSDEKRRRKILPMLRVEVIIAVAGYLLVFRICREQLQWPPVWSLDYVIVLLFGLGVFGLFVLHVRQLVADKIWMNDPKAKVPPGFLRGKRTDNGSDVMIRVAQVLTMERMDDNTKTRAKLRGNEVIEFTPDTPIW